MWSLRRLLLLAIAVILGAVGATYYYQKARVERQAPARPQPVPAGLDAVANVWKWSKTEGSRAIVEIEASNFREIADPGRIEIDNVTLRIYHKEGDKYDLVRSAKAQFEKDKNSLYSEGDVEIRMGLPAEGAPPSGRMVVIRTSGVTFETSTGKAATTRLATFEFDRGNGRAVGASYDPTIRELALQSQAELNWRGRTPKAKPMKIEAAQMIYKEREGLVVAWPWAKLTRDTEVIEANDATVRLEEGVVKQVVAHQARGTAEYPDRRLEFGGETAAVEFNDDGQVNKVMGERSARLVSTSSTSRTTLNSDRVDLAFDVFKGEAALKTAIATGHSSMQSAPVPKPGVLLHDTRNLRSDVIQLDMRPGGKELASVITHTPGTLEFVPNRPGLRRRQLDGERMWIQYGPENRIQSFRSTKVATVTDPRPVPAPKKGARPQPEPPPTRTWSQELNADFDPRTGQVSRLKQTGDFRYEEGVRKARADWADLDETSHVVALHNGARMWDDAGTTSADEITIDQKSGGMNAVGNVVSTRLPDAKGGSSSPMLSKDEPFEARAARMITSDRNQKIRYEGDAIVWQGSNRIRGEIIDIDRGQRVLTARGAVRSQMVDSGTGPGQADGAAPAPKKAGAPQFVVVEAPQLVYTDKDRLAHYTGGAHMTRAGLDVRGSEIRALMKDSKAESSSTLDKAFVDGQAVVVRSEPGRARRGTADHAEYEPDSGRFLLHGGDPVLTDSKFGVTRGREIVFFANDDKLVVNGSEQKPVITRIQRTR